MSINKVLITGNLTRDPELRETPSGFQVLNFGVAVNDRKKNQSTGQWEDYANFVDCTMFGNRAASVSRFLGKGSKDGSKRSKLEVVVDELEFMNRNENGSQGQAYGRGEVAQPAMEAVPYDDEIPF